MLKRRSDFHEFSLSELICIFVFTGHGWLRLETLANELQGRTDMLDQPGVGIILGFEENYMTPQMKVAPVYVCHVPVNSKLVGCML